MILNTIKEYGPFFGKTSLVTALFYAAGYGYGHVFKTNPLFTAKFAAGIYIATTIFELTCKKIIPETSHSEFEKKGGTLWFLLLAGVARHNNLIGETAMNVLVFLAGFAFREILYNNILKKPNDDEEIEEIT